MVSTTGEVFLRKLAGAPAEYFASVEYSRTVRKVYRHLLRLDGKAATRAFADQLTILMALAV